MRFCTLSCLLLLPGIASAAGSLRVSNVFGSHMVLQRDRPAPLWGWAAPGTAVHVQLGGGVAHASAVADVVTGFWKAVLPAQAASAMGRDIVINASGSTQRVVLQDVIFGEVLLCSGQSNMEFVLPAAKNASAEIAAADAYPHIRVFSGPMQNADRLNKTSDFNTTHDELKFIRMGWRAASAASVGGCADATGSCDECCGNPVAGGHGSYFSAICWLAARELADALSAGAGSGAGVVPVGAIDQSYGGTSIQFWMGARSIARSNAPAASQCCGQDGGASCLYNTQVHPYTLGPMQFAGVLFYQGEQNANCGGPTQTAGGVYSLMLQEMVAEWRAVLGGDGGGDGGAGVAGSADPVKSIPFGVILLAPWRSNGAKDLYSFAQLRLAQANLTRYADRTFVVSTLDQGDPDSFQVHSPYKQAVGQRAGLGIAALIGAAPGARYLAPRYKSASVLPSRQPEDSPAPARPGASVAVPDNVLVTFEPEGLYGAALNVTTGAACPAGLETDMCEAFAVQSAPDCVWHAASAVDARGATIVLRVNNASAWAAGNRAVATRAFFANWPVVGAANAAGTPVIPWLEPLDLDGATAATGANACPLVPPGRKPQLHP